ncbi:MAG: outer membrane protein assembly factor BamA [Hyphomicrobiales bacterium]
MSYRFFAVWLWALVFAVLGPVAAPKFLASQAEAQTISRIVVEGNQRIEPDTVISYMQINPGDPYDAMLVDESVKALFQTGLFADVKIFMRGSSLVVVVEENPLINRVNFEGNSEIKDKDLAKEVELRERTVLTRARVQSDVQRIITLYRRSGYYSARVEPKIIRLPQNRVDLVFEIDEGAETKVASIAFVGNQSFSDSDLRAVITTKESAWWKFMSTADRYDPDRLNYDKELLRRYYLKTGYADVKIISADAELAPDGESFYITFVVDEGPLYKIASVTIDEGDTNLDPANLRAVVALGAGEDYDATKIDRTVEKITIEAGKAGYAFAKVEPEISRDPANRTLAVTYRIVEGPRTYIERIDIVGNRRTRDEVIRRELRLYEGDAYNRVLVDRARRRLTALDFFEKIDFKEEQGSAPDKVILTIDLVEKSTGSLNFSAGYSTSDGVILGVSVSERNFMGRGQFVKLNTNLSLDRQSVDFSFTEPYFMGMPLAVGTDLYTTYTDDQTSSSYSVFAVGGALRAGFRIDEFQGMGFRYSLARRDVGDVPEKASLAIQDSEGVTWKSMIGSTYTYDDLDNPVKPTKGFRGKVGVDVAGLGGDVYYVGTEVNGWYFYPIYEEKVVLKLEANAGVEQPWNDKDVPIQDRYTKGGDSFRGFMPQGVGPRQENSATGHKDAIGGQVYAIGTVEMTFPLGLPEEFGLEGSVFSDFGTVFDAPEKTTKSEAECAAQIPPLEAPCNQVFDTAAMRASVGAGVIWQSPFGPLRVDLSYPFAKADYDKTEYFRFSFGSRF